MLYQAVPIGGKDLAMAVHIMLVFPTQAYPVFADIYTALNKFFHFNSY